MSAPGTWFRIAVVAALASPLAAAQSFYAGGAIIHSRLDSGNFEEQVSSQNGSNFVSSAHVAEMGDKTGGKVFAGLSLNRWLGIELDYARAGTIATRYRHVSVHGVAFANYLTSTRQELEGIGLSVLAGAPLSQRVAVHARAGLARTRLRMEVELCTFTPLANQNLPAGCGVLGSPRIEQTRPRAGLGLDFVLLDRVALRAEWDRYFGVGKTFEADLVGRGNARGKFDVDLFAVGVSYRF